MPALVREEQLGPLDSAQCPSIFGPQATPGCLVTVPHGRAICEQSPGAARDAVFPSRVAPGHHHTCTFTHSTFAGDASKALDLLTSQEQENKGAPV